MPRATSVKVLNSEVVPELLKVCTKKCHFSLSGSVQSIVLISTQDISLAMRPFASASQTPHQVRAGLGDENARNAFHKEAVFWIRQGRDDITEMRHRLLASSNTASQVYLKHLSLTMDYEIQIQCIIQESIPEHQRSLDLFRAVQNEASELRLPGFYNEESSTRLLIPSINYTKPFDDHIRYGGRTTWTPSNLITSTNLLKLLDSLEELRKHNAACYKQEEHVPASLGSSQTFSRLLSRRARKVYDQLHATGAGSFF